MASVTTTVRAWATPRPTCTCELCWPTGEPEATVTRRPPVRAMEPRHVRQVRPVVVDSAELVFGGQLEVY